MSEPPRRPRQEHPVPSQEQRRLRAFRQEQPFIQTPPPDLKIGAPPSAGYIVGVWPDAKPKNAVELQTTTGRNIADTDTGNTISLFYAVPNGFSALIRSWGIDAICTIDPGEGIPVVTQSGASNFVTRIDFFIGEAGENQSAGILSKRVPFGRVGGAIYFLALQNQVIEMRATALDLTYAPNVAYEFNNAEMSFNGTLFVARDQEPNAIPLNFDPVPVYRGSAT